MGSSCSAAGSTAGIASMAAVSPRTATRLSACRTDWIIRRIPTVEVMLLPRSAIWYDPRIITNYLVATTPCQKHRCEPAAPRPRSFVETGHGVQSEEQVMSQLPAGVKTEDRRLDARLDEQGRWVTG